MRQISTRICVSRERFGEAIFFVDVKTATPFHQSMPVCIKKIMAGKLPSAVVCCFKVSYNRLTAAILKDYRLKNIECGKYQLIFVMAD